METVIGTQALQDFIHEFKLMDNYSNIYFDALVELKTIKNEKVFEDRITITFGGFNNPGELKILEEHNQIDSELFPTEFAVKFQQFEFINQSYLRITGNHTGKPDIGKYSAIITPLK